MGGTALPLPKPQELPVPEDATTGVSPFTDNIEKQEYLRNLRDRTTMNASGHPLEAVMTSPESQIPKTPISINPSATTLKAGETVNLGDVPKPSLSVEKAKVPKAPLSVEPPDMFQYPEEAADWYEQKNHPGAARTARVIAGVKKGVANTAESLVSPANLAFLVATEGTGEIVPAIEELINAGFTAYQVKTAIDTIPQVKTALRNHDPEAAAQAMTESGIAGAFGAVGIVHGVKGVPEEQAPENVSQTSQSLTSASGRQMQVPPERTTGVSESDEAIRKGGGIPGGKFEKAGKMTHDLHLFHDPQTGSTLALPEDKVSPEAVSQHIAESRAKFAAGKNKLAEIPGSVEITSKATPRTKELYHPALRGIADTYGTSHDATQIKNGASFITPDGDFIHLPAGARHDIEINKATGAGMYEDNRPEFLNDTGAIRTRFDTGRAGDTVHISVPKQGVTEEQIPALRQAIAQAGRNGQVVLERADITPETKDELSLVQDFPRPADAEKYLRQIQAHPDQKTSLNIEKAANDFNAQRGRPPIELSKENADVELGKKTADQFALMKHEPQNPEVQKAFSAMKSDIDDQYGYVTQNLGIQIEPWIKEGEPYKNSKEMREDVTKNHHIYVSRAGAVGADNPFAEKDSNGLSYQDKFRALHDIFGHVAGDNEFGPNGERRAYINHRQMFSPEALPAVKSLTHGQNSWVNFGPHMRNATGDLIQKGEPGYIELKNRPFAENKMGILRNEERSFVPVDRDTYAKAVANSPHAASLSQVSEAPKKIFQMTVGGDKVPVYYSINQNGEMAGAVNNSGGSVKNALADIIPHAIAQGGDHLDAWDIHGTLPRLYEKYGFKIDQTVPYDAKTYGEPSEALKNSWRLSGWKDGEPYPNVVHMSLPEGKISKTSHATLSPIPSILKGGDTSMSDESIFGHEYGHGAHAVVNGGKLMGLYSHWHPKVMETGSAAAADIAWPSGGAKTFDEWITKDPNNAFKALQQALSGPVTQEVLYGIPVNKNVGAAGDMGEVADILQKLNLSPEQSNDVVDFLANSWKEKLTTKNSLTGKTLADIIKQYAPRNEDIREELLASPDKIQKFSQEVAQHEGELRDQYNRGNSVGVSEGTEQVGRENVARTEGRAETTNISKGIRRIPGAIEVTSESRAFPKGSAVPLLTNPLPTEQGAQKSLTPSDKLHQGVTIEHPVIADFQRAMGEWMKKTAGNINEPSAELSRSIRLAHNEVNHWIMENGGEGKGWYKRKTDAAIKVLSKAHPQLKDPAHATIFKALWTAHSYGNDPNVNMTEAEQNLSNLENKGKLEYDKGIQPDGKILHWSGHTGNVYTLAKTQHLIDKDGEAGAANWLTTKHTWPEIQDKFKDAGLNVSKKSIPLDKDGKTYGAMAFGPKGGAFFLNLNGINDFTTVDIWGARALRRWEGSIGAPDTLTKDYDSNLIVDRPPDAGEIERFHKVIQSVAKKLNLDTDDVQALQWYFEHKLYEVHGVGEKARDYEEAAKNVVNKKGGEPVNALALLKALGQWKSPVQSRGNEGASGASQKTRESSASGNLFKNH